MMISILSLFVYFLLSANHLEATEETAELETLSKWIEVKKWNSTAGKESVKGQLLAFLKLDVPKTKVYLYQYFATAAGLEKKAIFACGYVPSDSFKEVCVEVFVAGNFSESSSTFTLTNAGQSKYSSYGFYNSTRYAYCEEWTGEAAIIGHPVLSPKVAELTQTTGRTVVRCWFVSKSEAIVIFDEGVQLKGYSFVTMQIYDHNQIAISVPSLNPTLAEVHANIIVLLTTDLPFYSGWKRDSTSLSVFSGLRSKLEAKAKWIGEVTTLTVLAVNNDVDKMSCTLWKQKESWSTDKTLFVVWIVQNRPDGGREYCVQHIGWWSKCAEEAIILCRRYVKTLLHNPLEKQTNFEHGVEWLSPDETSTFLNSVKENLILELPKLNEESRVKGKPWVCQKCGFIPSRPSDGPLTFRILSVWKDAGVMTIVVNLQHLTQTNEFKILYIEEMLVNGETAMADCDTNYQGILDAVYPPLSPVQLTWDFVTPDFAEYFVTTFGKELEQIYGHALLPLKPVLSSDDHGIQLAILRADCNNEAVLLCANWNTKGLTWAGDLLSFGNVESEIAGLATIQSRALSYTTFALAHWTSQDISEPQTIKRLHGKVEGIVEIHKKSDAKFEYSFLTEKNVSLWKSGKFETLRPLLAEMAWNVENPFLRIPLETDEETFKVLDFHCKDFPTPATTAKWVGYKINGNTVVIVYRHSVNSSAEEYEYLGYTGVYHGTNIKELILTHRPSTALTKIIIPNTAAYPVENLIAELCKITKPFSPDMSNVQFDNLQCNGSHSFFTERTPWGAQNESKRVRGRNIESGRIEICSDHSYWFFAVMDTADIVLYVSGVVPTERDARYSSQKFLALPTAFCPSSRTNGICWYTEYNVVKKVTNNILLANTEFSESPVLSVCLLPSTAQQRECAFQYGVVIKVNEHSCLSSIVEVNLTYFGLIRRSFERGQVRCSKELAENDIMRYVSAVQAQNLITVRDTVAGTTVHTT